MLVKQCVASTEAAPSREDILRTILLKPWGPAFPFDGRVAASAMLMGTDS
jgi:hypothetical protein